MAYFDSSKNRALWEIELQSLRKEKAERKAGKVVHNVRQTDLSQNAVRGPERITYRELLKEEARASAKGAKKVHPVKMESKERQKEPQKEFSSKTRTHGLA